MSVLQLQKSSCCLLQLWPGPCCGLLPPGGSCPHYYKYKWGQIWFANPSRDWHQFQERLVDARFFGAILGDWARKILGTKKDFCTILLSKIRWPAFHFQVLPLWGQEWMVVRCVNYSIDNYYFLSLKTYTFYFFF